MFCTYPDRVVENKVGAELADASLKAHNQIRSFRQLEAVRDRHQLFQTPVDPLRFILTRKRETVVSISYHQPRQQTESFICRLDAIPV